MSLPSSEELQNMTPMMRQFFEIKKRAGDAILFFRMGDFYEIFGDDAEEVAGKLELVLTSREKGNQQRIPFCGVPHHSARGYWLKLLKMGYKVAIADQVENPDEAKGLVKRDLIRVMTPGCIDDLEGLEADAPNYLMAVHEEPKSKKWVLGLADSSTGELRCGEFGGLEEISKWVEKYRPKELLVRRFLMDDVKQRLEGYLAQERLSITPLPESPLRDKEEQGRCLTEIFGTGSLKEQPCGQVPGGEALMAAIMAYFRSLQACVSQFLAIRPLFEPDTMVLDETAKRDLELFETVRRRQVEGSLFHEINHTLSAMGARYLRHSLENPFLNYKKILERQDAVASLKARGSAWLGELRSLMKGLPDIERLTTRVIAGVAQPAELSRIQDGLHRAAQVADYLQQRIPMTLGSELLESIILALREAQVPQRRLAMILTENPGPLGVGLDVFLEGYDERLDYCRRLSREGEAQINAYENQLREETGISSLKVKNHKSFGLLIEVTKSNVNRVPGTFIRRQTMVNGERFVTAELVNLGEALNSALVDAVAREQQLYGELLQQLSTHKLALQTVSRALATIDMLQSLAWKADEGGYCQPHLSEDGTLRLIGARHPVVERFVGRHDFVPNDLTMEYKEGCHLLITGPNMAGKSTIMRQTAICAILHQMGSLLPAVEASLPLFDRVFTRVGAADDLSRGQSTFMVEMSEAAYILRQASPKSLVILDEVGRGTSTQDGLALASAILEELARHIGCYSLFATHYHELIPLGQTLPGVKIVQTEVVEEGDRIIFSHRLVPGASGSSFGIEVARLAGIPLPVIERAQALLLAPSPGDCPPRGSSQVNAEEAVHGGNRVVLPLERFGLLGQTAELKPAPSIHQPVIEAIKTLRIDRLTPLQALNILNDFKEMVENLGHPPKKSERTAHPGSNGLNF